MKTFDEPLKTIAARHVSGGSWRWSFSVPDMELPDADHLALLLVNASAASECRCPVVSVRSLSDNEGGLLVEADIRPLINTIETCRSERWKAHLAVKTDDGSGTEKTYLLKDPDFDKKKPKKDVFKRKFELVKAPVGETDFGDRIVEAVPDCVSAGDWVICVGDRCLRYMNTLKCVGTDYRIKNNKLIFKVTCPKVEGFDWKGTVLAYRYRLERDRCDYVFPAVKTGESSKTISTVTEVDLTKHEFRPINWDVRMVFEKDGEDFWCHMVSPELAEQAGDKGAGEGLQGLFTKQSAVISDEHQLSLTFTDKDNTTIIVQEKTPYSGFMFRLRERIAILIYRLMRKSLKKKKIFLVYEKYCKMAQDNGFCFFKYCMDNDMEKVLGRSIYYVIDKSQKDYAKLEPYKDHVLQYMSIKHMVYLLAARLLISSDSRKHGCAWRSTESVIRKKVLKSKRSVFLQHGVFGLKRSNEFKHGTRGGTDLFIASNELEKGFIMDNMGYKAEEVAVTGLARWDILEDRSAQSDKKRILVMPTWRKWLEDTTDEIFLESEYYHKYMDLINSDKLAKLLERHDLWMDFYVHPKISEQIKQFSAKSDRVRLIPFGSEPLNELMMDCSLLVTDYSSVCWDVYYMSKPVIFYQFDLAKYNEAQGAYMDLEKDLFGDRAETEDGLLALIEEAAEDGFKLKQKYADMREGLYAYIDHNNSKRTCEEIKKRGW